MKPIKKWYCPTIRQIQQSNFDNYPLARIAQIPENFSVHILPWDDVPTGVGVHGEAREMEYTNYGGPKFNPGRLSKLLKFVSKEIGYGKKLPQGRGIGIASHFTFGGYCAHGIEVRVSKEGGLSIERIVAAIDCGFAVHPNAVEAQIQGATVDRLSTALNLKITVKDGQIQQSNFDNYPLVRIAQIPEIFPCISFPGTMCRLELVKWVYPLLPRH